MKKSKKALAMLLSLLLAFSFVSINTYEAKAYSNGNGYPHIIAAGEDFSLVIASDDTLYSCGNNENGKLGRNTDGTIDKEYGRVRLGLGVKSVTVSSGGRHNLAIGDDGNLYAWGENTYGALGNGTNVSSNLPKIITLKNNVHPKK